MDKRQKTVTEIPAARDLNSNFLCELDDHKTRVCAYARVSTVLDEQQSSYEAQIKYYTDYIKKHAFWDFVGIYADEGISGTSTKHREGFNRMIADAQAGKIDLILTKSISRFARNVLDTIRITRELRRIGVVVFFEKENLSSVDPATEVQLTILASLAQDEARSLSQNIAWGKERSMMEGKISLAWSHFLGYDKGPDGRPVINEEQAEVVREIFNLRLAGKTAEYIASYLTKKHVPTPTGKDRWSSSTVLSILRNEKYKGDALLHKTFTVDYLTKKTKKNEGEVAKYYVANSHPAIIEPEVFDKVQLIINKQKCTKNSLSSKLVCAKCGGIFSPNKIDGGKHQYISWHCINRYTHNRKRKKLCDNIAVSDRVVKEDFVRAFNKLFMRKTELLSKCEQRLNAVIDRTTRDNLTTFKDNLQAVTEPIAEFNETIWNGLIKHAIISPLTITYVFLDGTQIRINRNKKKK